MGTPHERLALESSTSHEAPGANGGKGGRGGGGANGGCPVHRPCESSQLVHGIAAFGSGTQSRDLRRRGRRTPVRPTTRKFRLGRYSMIVQVQKKFQPHVFWAQTLPKPSQRLPEGSQLILTHWGSSTSL